MTAAAHGRSTAGRRGPTWRLIWIIPAGLSLLAGLDAALLLLGVSAPFTVSRLANTHGMLMTLGFVGTLISLERATALARWYGFLAPGLLGLGGIALMAAPVPFTVAKLVLVAGMAAFTLIYIPLWRRQYDAPLLTQLLGAAVGCVGTIVWVNQSTMDRVIPWLFGFVVLTIAAERVELARITMGPNAGNRLLLHAWAIVIALTLGMVWPGAGWIALGAALLALVGWLVGHDIARRTVRTSGAARYMAACILCGYLWLAIAAGVMLFGDPTRSQATYDAVIHAVMLGYTISMIMAHATTILPAVLHITLPYRPIFWIGAGILQLSLVVRLWPGDALGSVVAFQTGGVIGVIALLVFVATAIASAVMGVPAHHATTAPANTAGRIRTTGRPTSGVRTTGAPRHTGDPVGAALDDARVVADAGHPIATDAAHGAGIPTWTPPAPKTPRPAADHQSAHREGDA